MTHISEPIGEIMSELAEGSGRTYHSRTPSRCDKDFAANLQWLRDFINEDFTNFKHEEVK